MDESFIKLNDFLKLFLFKQKRQKLGRESLKGYIGQRKGYYVYYKKPIYTD